jgi:4-hydroxybenzoyl-CoA reductase subunit alpha
MDRRLDARTPQAVGVSTPLVDGVDKVSGQALYTADLPVRQPLVGRILRSREAHAVIVAIDTRAACALPGVAAVITGEDFTAPYGVIPIAQNEWPLARGKVRYRGEPLVAVAALDEATAQRALALVRVQLDPLPACLDARAARAAGAAQLHEDKPGNLEREVDQCFGDVEAGFAAAAQVLERRFHYAEIAHGQIELNATLAQFDRERGQLTVHSVTQVPYYLHLALARCLGMEESDIRVVKPFVGGGFGHRVEPLNFEIVTAALARAAGAAVKLELTREEVFLTHRGRPETDIRMKIAVDDGGRILAVDAEAVQRGGAYAGYGLVTILYAGSLLHALYRVGAVRYRGERVYSNTPPCGAMRGHGAVDIRHAFESVLDELAAALGMDPFALRRANLLAPPERTLNDLQVNSYGLPQCLDWVEQASGWRERRGALPRGRGLGMACSHYVSGSAKPVHWTGEPHAVVQLRVDFDAGITLLTGAADIGQGSSTLLTQVVAEVLSLPASRIRVVATDSVLTPKDNGSYSSRVSFMVGNAALRAAQALQQRLLQAASRRLQVPPEQIEWLGERCRVMRRDGTDERWPVLAGARAHGAGRRRHADRQGHWSTPPETQGGQVPRRRGGVHGRLLLRRPGGRGRGRRAHRCRTRAAGLGRRTTAVGRSTRWRSKGQVQGAVWMGMGQALSEETQYHQGLPLRANLIDYRMATIPTRRRSRFTWSRASTRWGRLAPRRPARAPCMARHRH